MVENGPIKINVIHVCGMEVKFKFASFPEWARAKYTDPEVRPIAMYQGWAVASCGHPQVFEGTKLRVLWCPGGNFAEDERTLLWSDGWSLLNKLVAIANLALARDALIAGGGKNG